MRLPMQHDFFIQESSVATFPLHEGKAAHIEGLHDRAEDLLTQKRSDASFSVHEGNADHFVVLSRLRRSGEVRTRGRTMHLL